MFRNLQFATVMCLLVASAGLFAGPVFADTCEKAPASCEGAQKASQKTGEAAHTSGVVPADDKSFGGAPEPKTQAGKVGRDSIDPMYRGG